MNKREFRKLILRINQDERAFEKLYNYYFGKIVYSLSLKYGEALAKDVTQEFFLKLINNPHIANGVEHPNAWMFTCCENLAKNKIKNIFVKSDGCSVVNSRSIHRCAPL